MPSTFSLAKNLKPVQIAKPQTTNGGVTSGVISLKNAVKAWIVAELNNATGFAEVISLRQSTTIAAGTSAAGPAVPIFVNEDVAATDTLVQQADAAAFATANVAKLKQVIFEIDPAKLTDGYPCVYVTLSDSSQAGNYCSVTAYLESRYGANPPPTAILD
jgi:hypothetical protein